jgi:hypothetical protein
MNTVKPNPVIFLGSIVVYLTRISWRILVSEIGEAVKRGDEKRGLSPFLY